jgi:biopolymer transport protein ExbD
MAMAAALMAFGAAGLAAGAEKGVPPAPATATAATASAATSAAAPVRAVGQIITPTRAAPPDKPVELAPDVKNQEVIKALPNIVIDRKAQTVTVDGVVCMREGYLELFATAGGIREWEALVEVKASPMNVNLALILLGLAPGNPVTWTDTGEVLPPAGPVVRIFIEYQKDGKTQRVEAHEWLIDNATDKMAAPQRWVYCGGATHNGHFLADYEGTVVCTANFPTAILDLPYESNSKGKYPEGLSFKCNTAVIPPSGTPIKLILQATGDVIKGPKQTWILIIDKAGKMTLEGQPSSLEDLEAKLAKKDQYLRNVQVQADPASAVGLSLQAMQLITKYNLEPRLMANGPMSSATSASPAAPGK